MNKKILGERIRLVRGELSRDAFAKKLEVAPLTIFKYEKGERTPDANFLAKLVKVSQCDPGWLLTGEKSEEGKKPLQLELMREVIEHVEEIFEKKKFYLPPKKKAEFIGLLYEDILEDESRREQLDERVVRLFKIAG